MAQETNVGVSLIQRSRCESRFKRISVSGLYLSHYIRAKVLESIYLFRKI